MIENFTKAGPTKWYFMTQTIFLMGQIFPAGKFVFRPGNDLNE
jgi:hypothetical protein